MGQHFIVGKGNTRGRCPVCHALEHLYEFGGVLLDVLFVSVVGLSSFSDQPIIGNPFQDPRAEDLDKLLIELISHFII